MLTCQSTYLQNLHASLKALALTLDGHLCMKLSPCKAWKAEDFELPGQDFNPSLMGSPDNATELLKECTA